ncbi:MAG: beta-mannosidase, partial [Bacteroidales bacterium]|nr:beta-mannosidase [Bacteroidales bacterium]
CRDKYYDHIFSLVRKGTLDGCNFWGWSGFAIPSGPQWHKGDDYTGDPAQEAQGLNGVYMTDSTIGIIKQSLSY